jgi:hypothetical protein
MIPNTVLKEVSLYRQLLFYEELHSGSRRLYQKHVKQETHGMKTEYGREEQEITWLSQEYGPSQGELHA